MLDQDVRTVTEALDAAQTQTGLDQAGFASALGTSASRYSTYRTGRVFPSAVFLARAIRIGAVLTDSAQRGVPTPLDYGSSIRTALAQGRDLWAFTLVQEARDRLDDTIRHRPNLVEAWEAAPRLNDPRWQTLLAATIGQVFDEASLPRPRWTEVAALDQAWSPVESIRYSPQEVVKRTPPWLAKVNIFVSAHDLSTA